MKTCRNNLKLLTLGATWALALTSCSNQDIFSPSDSRGSVIIASIEDSKTRTAVDGDPAEGVVGLLWTDGDELGVFDEKGEKHTRFTKFTKGSVAEAEFGGGVSWLGKYAYYPYSADNDGLDITALTGTLPAEQTVGTGNIPGDYKIGRRLEDTNKFVFAHIFSLVRLDLDATGTVLAGEPLEYVKFSAPSYIAGNFNFNLRKVTYSNVTNGSRTITLKWPEGTTLSAPLSEYFSVMPTIANGAELNFEVKTANYTATFSVNSKVAFAKEQLYNLPVNLANIKANGTTITVTDKDGKSVELIPGQPVEPETLTGTFTCATLNVNGLRTGSSGAQNIGNRITSDGWDFFAVSEDFQHNSLIKGLTSYNCGEAPGSAISRTDGIVLFWKKEGFSATGETRVKYNSSYGGIFDGADETKDKGFRYYLMTLKNGVEIDVYITHMNSGSNSGHLNARKDQLTQLAEYIKAHNNGRPIIFLGDTNCRYTRDYLKQLLIDPLAKEGIIGNDPWVDFQWNGTWPSCPSSSIMTGASSGSCTIDGITYPDDDNNGQGYGFQKGEVVDKVIYFNVNNSKVNIKANSYLHDESYGSLSDHWPIVVNFTYTTIK